MSSSLGTPSRVPARSNTQSQFASTPRFLLSQRSPYLDRESLDGNSPNANGLTRSSPAPTAHVAKRERGIPRAPRRKEIIEDSGSEPDQDGRLYPSSGTQTGVTDITGRPPESGGALDAEFQALFEPVTSRAKRRRVSDNTVTPVTQRKQKPPRDLILSSSPEPLFSAAVATTGDTDPPSPSLTYRTPNPTRSTTQQPPTPGALKPSSRGRPRFAPISSSQLPSSSQPQQTRPWQLTATPRAMSPPPKRKPTFVLPRPASPSQAEDPSTIPTPFSPSSNALRRRGRARSAAPSYLPGGMAAEVRSWILEMGAKREQLHHGLGRADHAVPDMQRYTLVVRITDVRQSALGSCGPLAFVQGPPIDSLDETPESRDEHSAGSRNVLLLGPPRLRQGEFRQRVPDLQAGDVIGVCRGLVWEVGLEGQKMDGNQKPNEESDYGAILQGESQRAPELARWLVGMEWELISSG